MDKIFDELPANSRYIIVLNNGTVLGEFPKERWINNIHFILHMEDDAQKRNLVGFMTAHPNNGGEARFMVPYENINYIYVEDM